MLFNEFLIFHAKACTLTTTEDTIAAKNSDPAFPISKAGIIPPH